MKIDKTWKTHRTHGPISYSYVIYLANGGVFIFFVSIGHDTPAVFSDDDVPLTDWIT
jgi:hypothetical protein